MLLGPSTRLKRLALGGAFCAVACLGFIAGLEPLLGWELDCFPSLHTPFKIIRGLGAVLVLLVAGAAVVSGLLQWRVEKRVSRHLGLTFLALALAVALFLPAAQTQLWHRHGCLCEPRGIVGVVSPTVWNVLYLLVGAGPSSRAGYWQTPEGRAESMRNFMRPIGLNNVYGIERDEPFELR